MLESLWQRVHSNPRDDEARRVLGDALLEAGDPRGELIAVQCQLASVEEDERGPELQRLVSRERELLDAHSLEWVKGWPFGLMPLFVRGFPQWQKATAVDAARHFKKARELAPTLTEVHFSDEDPRAWVAGFNLFVAVHQDTPFARLELPITFSPGDVESLVQLNVEALVFTGGTLGAVQKLARMPMRELRLEFDVGVRNLFPWPSLRVLVNRGNDIPELPALPDLERLTLDRAPARVVPSSFPKLQRLELFDTGLDRRGLQVLLEAGHPAVRRLGLRGARLEPETVASLERWPALEVLDVRGCTMPPRALDAPAVQRLRLVIR